MAFKAKSPPSVPSNNTDNTTSGFDCNICLDFVRDPVVTLCGHLYCWPCIYEWLIVQSTSLASDEHPQCPVCKAEVSQSTVVPLYGRGETPTPSGHNQGPKSPSVPPRPPAYCTRASGSGTAPEYPAYYTDLCSRMDGLKTGIDGIRTSIDGLKTSQEERKREGDERWQQTQDFMTYMRDHFDPPGPGPTGTPQNYY